MAYVKRRRKIRWVPLLVILGLLLTFLGLLFRPYLFPEKTQTALVVTDDKTPVIVGPDYNGNGISDTQDIINGARKDALAKPEYVNAYYSGGYPPDDEGVCTDLIWRAFKEAGYTLKDLVDADIKSNVKLYPGTWGYPDPNIDFRRVANLTVYFSRHAEVLTTDIYDLAAWQPGDIVIFGNNEHMGIVSDIRNENDIPYLIHNNGQEDREEDRLEYGSYTMGITAHYRFTGLK